MAHRRPITTHPGFAPLLALWFAALLGLVVAVLPAAQLARLLAVTGLGAIGPVAAQGRLGASLAAAFIGALLGLALALPLTRRGRRDPRPVYAEHEAAAEEAEAPAPRRRPLRVREELAEELSEEPEWGEGGDVPGFPAAQPAAPLAGASAPTPLGIAESEEGFMILTPQPAHPPRPAPDLEALLAQFDTALAAFRADDEAHPVERGADPVHAFVARQTGGPTPVPGPSPLASRIPDHQAELRAALDKLARAQQRD